MSCCNCIGGERCCHNLSIEPEAVFIINASDVTWDEEGVPRLKRKYGKFTRPVYELKTAK